MCRVPSSPRPPRREQIPSVALLGGSGIFAVFVTVAIGLLRNVFVAKAIFKPPLRRQGRRSQRPPSSVGIVGAVGCVPHVMSRHHRGGGNDLLDAVVLLAGVLRVGIGIVVPAIAPAGALAHRGVGRVVRRRDDGRGGGGADAVPARVDVHARRGGGVGDRVSRLIDGGIAAVVGAHRRGHDLRRRGLLRVIVVADRGRRRRRVEFALRARLLRAAGIAGRVMLLLLLPRGTRGGDGAATESRAMGIVTPMIVVPVMMMGGVRTPLSRASAVVVGALMLDDETVGGLGSARLDLALLPVDEDVSGLSRDGR